MFDIHEDTPGEEAANLMEHSTCTLEISDDEGQARKDDRGKENIPPEEQVAGPILAAALAPASRMDTSSSERIPLGDLDLKEFYEAGCDASSCLVISADEGDRACLDKDSKDSDTPDEASKIANGN